MIKKMLGLTMVVLLLSSFAPNKTQTIGKAKLRVAGLTCSMCSRATEKSLQTLDFISSISVDLNDNIFLLTFKEGKMADPDKIRQKVEAAGFSVDMLELEITIPGKTIAPDEHYDLNGLQVHFVTSRKVTAGNTPVRVKVIDKNFIPQKEYKINEKKISFDCYRTGITQNCCKSEQPGKRMYHFEILP